MTPRLIELKCQEDGFVVVLNKTSTIHRIFEDAAKIANDAMRKEWQQSCYNC